MNEGHSWEDIRAIMESRRREDSEIKKRMIEVRDRYNGDYVLPLPDVKGEPELPMVMPNLVADGIETLSLRAAAVDPMIVAPALKMDVGLSVRRAEKRRRAWAGCWHCSNMSMLRRRAYRQLNGYGEMAWVVVPDFKRKRAVIETRDALTTYADNREPDEIRRPDNVGFVVGRTAQWIISNWGSRLDDKHYSRIAAGIRNDEMWEVVEWLDEWDTVIGILGERTQQRGSHYQPDQRGIHIELFRWPNRTGVCPAVVGRRVTLDRIAGQMDTMIPTYDLANRMMALEVDAMERSIYPDRYVIGQDAREPQIVGAKWMDGRTGEVNRLMNVASIGTLNTQPSQMTPMIVDRLESAIRQSSSVNAIASGLNPGSLRTGRALDSFQGFSIEPRLIELNDIMARALTGVNETVALLEKAYFGGGKITTISGDPGDQGVLEYDPDEVWETELNLVAYPLPGADINNMTLAAGQMVGAKIGSRRDAMAMHPAIKDVDRTMREIMVEDMDIALLQGFQQQLASGGLPVPVAAAVKAKVLAGMTLEEAIEEADKEMRERQAAEAQTAPEAMPGMVPGAPNSAAPPESPQTIGASPDQTGFRELLNALSTSTPRSSGGRA